jgi:hypothetical protein
VNTSNNAAIIALAEQMAPAIKEALWLDRAEAAVASLEHLSLRDLRATVVGAAPRDEHGRELDRKLREALDQRVTKLRDTWAADMTRALEDNRVLQALRLSSRPPEPSARFPAALVSPLAEAAGAAMTSETPSERWTALLEAAVTSPIRRSIKPQGIPAAAEPTLLELARASAGQVPALAGLLGMTMPPPPRPAPGLRRPPPPPRVSHQGRPLPPPPPRIATATATVPARLPDAAAEAEETPSAGVRAAGSPGLSEGHDAADAAETSDEQPLAVVAGDSGASVVAVEVEPDGSLVEVELEPDGSAEAVAVEPDGSLVEVELEPDASVVAVELAPDGSAVAVEVEPEAGEDGSEPAGGSADASVADDPVIDEEPRESVNQL